MHLQILMLLAICCIPMIGMGQEIIIDFSAKTISIEDKITDFSGNFNETEKTPFAETSLSFKNEASKSPEFKIELGDLSNPAVNPTAVTIDFNSTDLLSTNQDQKNAIITLGPNSKLTLENRAREQSIQQGEQVTIRIDPSNICNSPGFVFPYMIDPTEQGSDYLLILDFEKKEEVLRKYKKEGWTSKKKTITSNKQMEIKVINKSYGEFDEISHDISYSTLFLEDQERFQTLLGGGSSDSGDGDAGETTGGEEEEGEAAETTSQAFLDAIVALARDLKLYYDFVYEFYPSQGRFDTDYGQIKKNVSSCFGIDQFGVNSFLVELTRIAAIDDEKEAHQNIAYISKYLRILENYQIYSPEFFRVKREDQMSVKIDFNKKSETDPVHSEVFNYKLRGGWKIDFSAGLFYTTLSNSEFTTINEQDDIDDMGTTDDTSDDVTTEQKKIVQESENDNSVGVGVLTHIYPKLTGGINLGGTIGFMANGDAISQFAAGISVMIPAFKSQRIVFTYGAVYGGQTKLRSKYTVDQVLPASELENVSDDQLTIANNDWGSFFSISWNFGSINVGDK